MTTGGFRIGDMFVIDILDPQKFHEVDNHLLLSLSEEQIKSLHTTLGGLLNPLAPEPNMVEDGPVIWCTKCGRVRRHEYDGREAAIFQEREMNKKLSKKQRAVRDQALAMFKLIFKCRTCGATRFYGTYAEKGKHE